MLIQLRANCEAAFPNVNRELIRPPLSIFSCRKRHNSEAYSDSSGDEYNSGMWSSGSDERSATPIMSECTAALVLMNLSLSPGTLGGGNGGLGGVAHLQRRQQPSKRQQIAPPPEGERTCVFATAILKVHSFSTYIRMFGIPGIPGHGQWARVRFCRRGVTPDRMVCLLHVNSRTPPSDEKSLFDSFATNVGRTTRAAKSLVVRGRKEGFFLLPPASVSCFPLMYAVGPARGGGRGRGRLIARVFPRRSPFFFPSSPDRP